METASDVARNPESFLQIGDLVGGSFFFSSMALFIVAVFLIFRLKYVPSRWKSTVLIATLVPLIAAMNSFYRRNYWVTTQTSPTEFRFFDWFLTVPLMAVLFYFLLKPLGAKIGMLISLIFFSLVMLLFGYLGEAVYPEESIKWGILGSAGFAGMIGVIMGGGYPRIFNSWVDPVLQRGYLWLSLLLPLGWTVYPIGYMTVPGNMLEGFMSLNSVTIMYNIADVLNKAGLALGVYYIAVKSEATKDEMAYKLSHTSREQTREITLNENVSEPGSDLSKSIREYLSRKNH